MFSQFLTILTCVAMLWHTIGGCCWHHNHRECDAHSAMSEAGSHDHHAGARTHSHPSHDHHADRQSGDGQTDSPAPCNHRRHCDQEDCVYVKSCTPDVTPLYHSRVEFVAPMMDLLAAEASETLRATDRVVLRREELSSQHQCALTQSWLL